MAIGKVLPSSLAPKSSPDGKTKPVGGVDAKSKPAKQTDVIAIKPVQTEKDDLKSEPKSEPASTSAVKHNIFKKSIVAVRNAPAVPAERSNPVPASKPVNPIPASKPVNAAPVSQPVQQQIPAADPPAAVPSKGLSSESLTKLVSLPFNFEKKAHVSQDMSWGEVRFETGRRVLLVLLTLLALM